MTDLGDRLRASTKRAIEALVLVAEEPLTSHLLAQLLEVSPVVVDQLCRELAESYAADGRGFQLVQVAGGYRYQTHPDQAPYVERLVLEGQSGKLSAAALETLAIVAYKQPLSRAQVASIRGVSVDGVMRTLQQRGFIDEIGKDPGPGQAILFGTTKLFLEKLGLNSLDQLPPLREFVPAADVVEQLERGLRPDREPLRPEDAMPRDGSEGDADDGIDEDADVFAGLGAPDDLSELDDLDAADDEDEDETDDFGELDGPDESDDLEDTADDDIDDQADDDDEEESGAGVTAGIDDDEPDSDVRS